MDQYEIQDCFEEAGYYHLGSRLATKIWIKDLVNEDEIEVLEAFLESYDFADHEPLLLDNFIFHFHLYKRVYHQINYPYF